MRRNHGETRRRGFQRVKCFSFFEETRFFRNGRSRFPLRGLPDERNSVVLGADRSNRQTPPLFFGGGDTGWIAIRRGPSKRKSCPRLWGGGPPIFSPLARPRTQSRSRLASPPSDGTPTSPGRPRHRHAANSRPVLPRDLFLTWNLFSCQAFEKSLSRQ